MSTVHRNSIRDVAVLAAVSVGTVSNVLNKPELVTPSTRDRVLAAVAELGFIRNGAARSLRAGESRIVGAIVLDIGNPFFTDVARGVEDRLRGHIRWAVEHGVTAAELDAMVTLLAVYVGFPRASIANEIVRDELARLEQETS